MDRVAGAPAWMGGDVSSWELAVDEIPGLLNVTELGDMETMGTEEVIELLSTTLHLQRFKEAKSPAGQVLVRILEERVRHLLPQEVKRAIHPAHLGGWLGQARAFESWGDQVADGEEPGVGLDHEALRLFRRLDDLRLAILAARRYHDMTLPDEGRVQEAMDFFGAHSTSYLDIYPYVQAHLQEFGDGDHDLSLYGTIDIYAMVQGSLHGFTPLP